MARSVPVLIGPDADHTFTHGFRIVVPTLTANRVYQLNDVPELDAQRAYVSLWPCGSLFTLRLNRAGGSEILTLQNGTAGAWYACELYFDASTGWQVFYATGISA
jgi:hypothetical protein